MSEENKDWNEESDEKWRRTKKFGAKWKKRVIYDETADMHSFVKKSFKLIIDLKNKKSIDTDNKESFDNMCKRLGYTESSLNEIKWQFVIESRGLYTLSLVAIFITFYSMSSMNFFVILSSLMMIFVFGVSGFVRAFRAWQINNRELKSFKQWLKSYEDWIV